MSLTAFARATLILSLSSLLALTTSWRSVGNVSMVELAVDTANTNQDGLLVLYGGNRLGGDIGLPVGSGDINGDGFDDVIFCAMFASAGGTKKNNGQINFYLSDGSDSGIVDAAQNLPNLFWLRGADSGDILGTSVATGDVNGDGLADVAIGAVGDDGFNNGRFNSGAVYLVLGSTDFSLREDLGGQLGGGLPPGVIAFYGSQLNGRTGIWVDIGDLDGDGYADIAMGADQLNGPGGQHLGGACIVFGQPDFPQVVDLANPPPEIRMVRIFGSGNEEHWGASLHIGDINNDGIKDLTIAGSIFRDSGSFVTPDNDTGHEARAASFGGTRLRCGEAFVIYGSTSWPYVIDLSAPPANATRIIGAKEFDYLGSQIHSGDLNGDGKRELIVGALQAEAPDNRGRTGAVHIIWGTDDIEGAVIDMADPDASGLRTTTIYGINNLDCAGDSVRTFDINNDGMSDLFIGSPEHNFEINGVERHEAGDTKFFFGQPGFLPAVIKLYDPPPDLRIYQLAGGRSFDEMSYRLAGGDVDGDGFIDYIANAMHGDGFENRLFNAGNVYVFSGRKLSERLGMMPVEPEPPPMLGNARLFSGGQAVNQANAGQSGLSIIVDGAGFRADTEVTINGMVVQTVVPGDPGLAATRRTVNLDANPAVRDSVGPLVVRVRNTDPPSLPTQEIIAGNLIGPFIDTINTNRKPNGAIVLKIKGSGFLASSAVFVEVNGQPVQVKKVIFQSAAMLKVKIGAGSAPPAGTQLRVRVGGLATVLSNEFTVAAP